MTSGFPQSAPALDDGVERLRAHTASDAELTRAVVAERADTRQDPPMLAGERESLESWLELYRESLLLKIAGLDARALCARSVPPSTLSLLGLVRHLTEVEAYWLQEVLHGQEVPDLYSTRENPDGDHLDVDPAHAERDVAAYEAQVATSRTAVAGWADLDTAVRGQRRGAQLNLRWILIHLIEEYARHLGHMDLLREAIDGRTGY